MLEHRDCFGLPCPSKVQAAIHFAVKLCVINVESQRLGEGSLQVSCEFGQFLLDRRRITVENEPQQLCILEHKDLDFDGVLHLRSVGSLDSDFKIAVSVSSISGICLHDSCQLVNDEDIVVNDLSQSSPWTLIDNLLDVIVDWQCISINVHSFQFGHFSVNWSVDFHAKRCRNVVALGEFWSIVINVNDIDLHLDLIKVLEQT